MTTVRRTLRINAGLGLPAHITDKVKECRLRIQSHEDHPEWFKGYAPDKAILTPAVDALEGAEHDVETDKNAVPARNDADTKVTDLFDELRAGDLKVARANRAQSVLILTLARLKLPGHKTVTPKGPHVVIANGEATLLVPAYTGKGNCMWEARLTTDGGATFAHQVGYSHREMLLEALVSGQKYGVSWRTKTGKTSTPSDWSAIIPFTAP